MSYYLVFDTKGRFKGYTKQKSVIETFKEQRKKRNRFTISKVSDDFFTKKMKKILNNAFMEIEEYHGVHLLQEEYEEICEQSRRIFSEMYRILDGLFHHLGTVIFNDKEQLVMVEFVSMIQQILEAIELGICSKDDRVFSHYFRAKKVVMHVMKLD